MEAKNKSFRMSIFISAGSSNMRAEKNSLSIEIVLLIFRRKGSEGVGER